MYLWVWHGHKYLQEKTMPTIDQIMIWAKENQLLLGLIGSAIIGAMPETLPATVKAFPQWMWTWTRDSAKTFLNFRRQLTEPTIQQQRIAATQHGNQGAHNSENEVKKPQPQQLNG